MLTFKILVYHSKHKIIHNAMKTIHLKIYIQNPNLKKKNIKKMVEKKLKKTNPKKKKISTKTIIIYIYPLKLKKKKKKNTHKQIKTNYN
jgi:hypothetical protein